MAAPFHFGVFGDGLRINYTIVTLSGIILFHWKSKSWRKTLDKPMPTWKRFLLLFLCCEFTTKFDSGFTILSCFYQPRSGRSCDGVGQKLLMVTYEFLAIVASMFGDFQYLQIFSTNFINYFPPITIDFH